MTKLESAAEKVAGNAILAAGARIVMVVGVPVTLMIGGSYASTITGLHNKVQNIEVRQAEMAVSQAAVSTRLNALEVQNQAEAGRFATLERQIAEMTGMVNAMNRNLERLLNRSEMVR